MFEFDNRIRRAVSLRVGKVIDRWVEVRVPQSLLDEHGRRLDEAHRRLDELERVWQRVDELNGRLDQVQGRADWTANEVERMIPHVASQESQLEALRQKLTVLPPAEPGELAEARSLIDEVRREHAQVRARLTGIAKYEERLGRLEERLRGESAPGTEGTRED
jgi:tetrahydromethanopterin S-methyltransferase subunit G